MTSTMQRAKLTRDPMGRFSKLGTKKLKSSTPSRPWTSLNCRKYIKHIKQQSKYLFLKK